MLRPFSSTVQVPQTPCSHPMCVPISPRSSRSTSTSSLRGSTVTVDAVAVHDQRDLHAAHLRSPAREQRQRDAAAQVAARDVDPGLGAAVQVTGRGQLGDAGLDRRGDGVGVREPCRPGPARPPSARTGVPATPLSASAARTTAPPSSSITAATPTSAKLPCVRANSTNACPPARRGKRTSVRISPGSRAVLNGPVKNSAAGIGGCRRARPRPAPRPAPARPRAARRPGRRAPGCRRRCRCCGSAGARRSRAPRPAAAPPPPPPAPAPHRTGGPSPRRPARRRRLRIARSDVDQPQVDQVAGLGQPEVHQRDQALPAGEHPRLRRRRARRAVRGPRRGWWVPRSRTVAVSRGVASSSLSGWWV